VFQYAARAAVGLAFVVEAVSEHDPSSPVTADRVAIGRQIGRPDPVRSRTSVLDPLRTLESFGLMSDARSKSDAHVSASDGAAKPDKLYLLMPQFAQASLQSRLVDSLDRVLIEPSLS
jgi:hypothetical protein